MKKVGLIKLLVGLTLATSGAFAVGSALSNKKAEPAHADSYTVYINTANWGDDATGVKFYAWAWESGQSGSWHDFIKVKDHVYSISIGDNINNFSFFRAASNMSHGFDQDVNYWNRTGDLTASDNKDYFVFSGYSTGSWEFYKDSYIYYISDKNTATENKIYSWYVKQFGNWSGTAITSISDRSEVQGTLHFNGNNVKIYKIPFSSRDTGLLFNYNGSSQSGNKTFGAGYAYTWEENDPEAAGLALELLLDIEDERNKSSWNGHNYSVCGISSSKATSFVNRYNALSAAAKGYINNSTTYTYKDSSGSDQDNISYQLIIQRLGLISGITISSSKLMNPLFGDNNSNTIAIIVIISLVSVTAIGGYFFIKRRQEN